MRRYGALAAAISLGCFSSILLADQPCDPVASSAPKPPVESLAQTLNRLHPMNRPATSDGPSHLIDAQFRYEVIGQGKSAQVQSVYSDLTFDANARMFDLLLATSGQATEFGNSFAPATSFKEAMSTLRQNAGAMSLDEKLLYLSMLGDSLSKGYDETSKANRSFDEIFQNLQAGAMKGGECGSIHEYIEQAARALGLQPVGPASTYIKSPAGGTDHWAAMFKDPKTGRIYAQSYSQIVNTGRTTVQGALNAMTQLYSPITTVTAVETRPGVFHIFVPDTARWVEDKLKHQAQFSPKDTLISIQAGNHETNVGIQIRKDFGRNIGAKGFVMHSEYQADEGKYALDAVGVAAQGEAKLGSALNGLVDEVNVMGRVYGGGLAMSAPDPLNPGRDMTRTNGFFDADVKGTARINQVTGKLELESKSDDLQKFGNGFATFQVHAGAEYKPSGPFRYEAERMFEAVPKDAAYFSPALHTAHDKISVIFDNRGDENKAYVVVRGDVYALEGVEKMAATGVRLQAKAVIPTEQRGEFVVLADAAKIVRNKSKDPFYDTPLSSKVGMSWHKAIDRTWEMSAGVDWRKNRMNSVFGDTSDPIIPGISDRELGTRRMMTVGLRATF